MLPARLEPEAFFRAIADRAGDGPQIGLLQPHVHIDHARLAVARRDHFAGCDRDRGNKSGGSDRAPQVEFQAALVAIARIEPCNRAEMAAGEEIRVAADDIAEDVFAVGRHRQGKIALLAGVIDQQGGRIDLSEGIAGFAQRDIKIELFLDDLVALEKIAALDLESGA